ncbi:nitroreductase family protein [Glaesserella parasuis]|uniref:nitroreductase family protein n=1 Tax=Glaesserella parasuis TaxID=738 RepID=UPI0003ABD9D1|nr:oxidoreductase domain protein [Glaesserella parasuis 84-15995]
METLDLLQRRRSSKKFGQDVPNAEQLENMFKAAVRAPDHGRLKPYHFVVIEPTKTSPEKLDKFTLFLE